jgi:hypothetical protein
MMLHVMVVRLLDRVAAGQAWGRELQRNLRYLVEKMPRMRAFLLLILVVGAATSASPQATDAVPVAQFDPDPSTDMVEAAIRSARARFFNNPGAPELTPNEALDRVVDSYSSLPSESPSKVSSTILVADVSSAAAYLSADHRDTYSEYRVTVASMLKATTPVDVGTPIFVLRRGGALALPQGGMARRTSSSNGFLYGGRRYLLFLNQVAALDGFLLLTAYELPPDPAQASPVDSDWRYLRYPAQSSLDLLSSVRLEVAQ